MNPLHSLTRSAWFFASVACSTAPAPSAASASSTLETKAPEPAANAKDPVGGPSGQAAQGPAAKPAAGTTNSAGSTIASVNAKEDAHWVQADDYFVALQAFDKGYQYVRIAKMKEPAPPGPEGTALFFIIKDGSDVRSAHFYRTRPAVKSDLLLGNLLICFDDNHKKDVYLAPASKDNARPGGWWLGRITDLSDLEKGYATLAGRYHCAPDALRAIVK